MARFMLDTSICVELLRGRAASVFRRFQSLALDEVAISSVTLAELQYGASRSARPAHNSAVLIQFCAPLAILSFDQSAASTYGTVRTALERGGEPIGPLDTLIASHALSLGLTVVTTNDREFRRVAGLSVENWLDA